MPALSTGCKFIIKQNIKLDTNIQLLKLNFPKHKLQIKASSSNTNQSVSIISLWNGTEQEGAPLCTLTGREIKSQFICQDDLCTVALEWERMELLLSIQLHVLLGVPATRSVLLGFWRCHACVQALCSSNSHIPLHFLYGFYNNILMFQCGSGVQHPCEGPGFYKHQFHLSPVWMCVCIWLSNVLWGWLGYVNQLQVFNLFQAKDPPSTPQEAVGIQ